MSATATVTAPNGRAPRKQLSDQLDRLDTIIDALAEGLPGAVADACREGARQAVKDAVVEIITNPELSALLDALRAGAAPVPVTPAPEPVRAPGLWTRLKAKVAAARAAATGAVVRAKEALVSRVRATRAAVSALGALTGEPLPWRRVLWVGAGVGLVVGLTCLAVPHTAAAVVGALGAATTSVAAQVAYWLKRGARRFGLI